MKYKNIILKIIHAYIPKCKVYLFGSRARKSNEPNADIDLAIDSESAIKLSVISSILEDIEGKNVPFFVDIVDLYTADENIKSEIKKDGILWSD